MNVGTHESRGQVTSLGLDMIWSCWARRMRLLHPQRNPRTSCTDEQRTACFWLHGDSGPLIICMFLYFVHVSTTIMLCCMKMWFMWFLWHGDVRPGPVWFIFMKWHRCWYAGCWLGGVRGGWDGRDGLLGTMRRKAFNKIDLERDKEQSSSGYSSFCMKICCYVFALHLYLSTHLLLWQKLLRYLRICHFFCYSTIILWSMSSSTIDNNKKKQQQQQPQQQQQH